MADLTSFKKLLSHRSLKNCGRLYELWRTTQVAIPNPTDLTLLKDFPHNEIDIAEKIKWVMAKCGLPWERYNPVYPMPRDQTVACPIEGCQTVEFTDTQSVKKHLGTVTHMVLLAKILGLPPAALLILRHCSKCNQEIYCQRPDSFNRHTGACKARRESAPAQDTSKTRGTRRAKPYSLKDRPSVKSVSDPDPEVNTVAQSESQVASSSQTQSSVFDLGGPSAPVSAPQFCTGCFALDPTIGSFPSPWVGTLSSQTPAPPEPRTPSQLEHSPLVSLEPSSDPGYFFAIPGYPNIPLFHTHGMGKLPVSFEDVSDDDDMIVSTDDSGLSPDEFSDDLPGSDCLL
ncbi:unnamed protein product [Somion occarium]|uniref:Uncharacterized protein n=1 Tax=Somion occarium TaxID=3059160 RepID=A0ABP1CU61_9APHY